MKRVLVTGASGWVGRFCLPPLIERRFEVHGVYVREPIEAPGVKWHRADLLNESDRGALIEKVKPTHLLHLAWNVQANYRASEANWAWLAASADLGLLFYAHGGHRIVGAGTCLEYDWSVPDCRESHPAEVPSTPYGRAKLILFHALARLAQTHGESFAWGRIFFSFGPHEAANRLVPAVAKGLLRGERVACSEGNQVRDFISIEDLGEAFAALTDSEVFGPVNMAGPYSMPIRDLVSLIASRIETEGGIDFGARPTAGDDAAPILKADISRLTNEVGFRPKYPIESAVDRTIAWWRVQ